MIDLRHHRPATADKFPTQVDACACFHFLHCVVGQTNIVEKSISTLFFLQLPTASSLTSKKLIKCRLVWREVIRKIAGHPGFIVFLPSRQTSSGRSAERGGHVRTLERCATRHDRVEVRGVKRHVPKGTTPVVSPLVWEEKQDVGLGGCSRWREESAAEPYTQAGEQESLASTKFCHGWTFRFRLFTKLGLALGTEKASFVLPWLWWTCLGPNPRAVVTGASAVQAAGDPFELGTGRVMITWLERRGCSIKEILQVARFFPQVLNINGQNPFTFTRAILVETSSQKRKYLLVLRVICFVLFFFFFFFFWENHNRPSYGNSSEDCSTVRQPHKSSEMKSEDKVGNYTCALQGRFILSKEFEDPISLAVKPKCGRAAGGSVAFPYGLVVRIRRSHRRGPGSIPGVGKYFLWSLPCVSRFFRRCSQKNPWKFSFYFFF